MRLPISPFRIKPSVIFAAFLALSGSPLLAQTTWTGAGDGTSWNSSANWSNGVPSTAGQARFLNGSLPDAPINVTVGPGSTPFRALNFVLGGNRALTISGSTLYLEGDASNTTATWNTSSGAAAPVTINSNIEYSNTVADTNLTFQLNLATPITFNGNITPTGTGGRNLQILGSSVVTINGTNSATFLSFGGSGELIAGSTTALGAGGVQKTSNSTLSLRSDVTINTTGANTYSWLQNTVASSIRISEAAPSSANRTLTMNGRITGSGTMQFVDNVNSTGNLILELKFSGGTAQNLAIDTHQSTIVRFAQTGTTTYSAVIAGDGQLAVTGGGRTIINTAQTYTGVTTVTSGTLSLTESGSIADSSEIRLDSGTRLDISGISASSYTFGAAQTLAGTGTISSGGKNLTVNGTLAPGNSPGDLTFDLGGGTLSLGADISFVFELGTLSDRVLVNNGTLNIGTGVLEFDQFDFIALSGFGVGDYTLFQSGTSILGTLGANTTGEINGYSGELRILGNNLVLTVVPEPSTALLLLGACGTASLLFRKKRA